MWSGKAIISVFVAMLLVFWAEKTSLAQQEAVRGFKDLTLDSQSEIRFAAPWTPSAMKYTNAQELVIIGGTKPTIEAKGIEQLTQFSVARALITVEPRSSYADAITRLETIRASRTEPAEFIEIGGWPAVEVKFSERLPRRGAKAEEEAEPSFRDLTVQRLIMAIAADKKVIRFDVTVLPDAPQGALQEAQALTRTAHFATQGDPSEVQETLQRMRAAENRRHSLPLLPQGAMPEEGFLVQAAAATQTLGVPVAVQTGRGELEIARTADANNVVIASNGGLSFSTNRAAAFAAGLTGVFGLDDPTSSCRQRRFLSRRYRLPKWNGRTA